MIALLAISTAPSSDAQPAGSAAPVVLVVVVLVLAIITLAVLIRRGRKQ
jgi:hypothetical protein